MTSRASVFAGSPAQRCFTVGVFRYLSASFIVCCAAPLGAFFFIQKNTVWTSMEGSFINRFEGAIYRSGRGKAILVCTGVVPIMGSQGEPHDPIRARVAGRAVPG